MTPATTEDLPLLFPIAGIALASTLVVIVVGIVVEVRRAHRDRLEEEEFRAFLARSKPIE
ncbi:hypothetical protein LG314_05320 [Agrococcus terreus]|uniref:hypothetical protein n=1 Tax=Agrococcus terreus TaxID=574649 RepID=UPI00384F7E6F